METQPSRLLYIGDVPVESSYHGSALLYRLLQDYPPDRLRVVEGNLYESLPERRLPGVAYKTMHVGHVRLMNTRFHEWYSLWLSFRSVALARRIPVLLDGFTPEAVLTVVHGYLWMAAAEFAQHNRLPLHVIVHDDWPGVARLPQPFTNRVDRQFGRVYRAAVSRLCVSPFMAAEYQQRYAVEGQVLYPSRAEDAKIFDGPPERLRPASRGLVFAFAGTLSTPDYCRLVRTLAECLKPHGGIVLIFGPMTAVEAIPVGLNHPNIRLCGLLKSSELMDRLRAEVDVLFVPMSFAARDRTNMEMGFPSKLVDYTAVGLPLLIVGPTYCSAVRWAGENPGVAEVVDADDTGRLGMAVERLVYNPEHRIRLAEAALAIGKRFFSHATAHAQLHAALRQSRAA